MIEIHVQPTPNPMALKFIVDRPLKAEGKATFSHATEAEGLPLVASVFAVPGVKQVHLFQNTMTVTHNGELNDEDLAAQVESVLQTRASVHNPEFHSVDERAAESRLRDLSSLSPERRQIEEILDRTIRPGLQADGGDVEVISFENNELRILYQGACGGCPSSMMGTLDAIQGILQHELDNPNIIVVPI